MKKLGRMKRHSRLVLPLFLLLPGFGFSQDGTVKEGNKELGITRDQASEILDELRQIRQLLEGQAKQAVPSPRAVPLTGKLTIQDGISLGSRDAPITIVEFTDYECPYCRQFEATTFAEIRKKYIDTGKVRFVSRDFPLDNHINAMPSAVAAHCAGDQDNFWPMHDALFGGNGKLTRNEFIEDAETLKLNVSLFKSCLDSGKHVQEIRNERQVAASLQIQGTPSFLIGKTNGDEVSGSIIQGALPLSAFEEKIRQVVTAR
jgi:protein-disulfide isomerase